MSVIRSIRPVLLSAPYSEPAGNLEVMLHLPSGMRSTGLVEITLDNGVKGLGEGYVAVFAPHVFAAIVDLISPIAVGRDIRDLDDIVRKLETATGYWSYQGAARHVVSAFEIALQDARAQCGNIPLWKALGGAEPRMLNVYASGGDSISPDFMEGEIEAVGALGITTFKIRARKHQAAKVRWCRRAGALAGIAIAIDMTQNLAVPSQSAEDVRSFVAACAEAGSRPLAFLEEVQGPQMIEALPSLRRAVGVPIAGGEIVTTPEELNARIRAGCYEIAQPDATVIGGIGPVLDVFETAKATGTRVYVHCWGAGVGMLANYHAAIAGGGNMVEWPMPRYPLRDALFAKPVSVANGRLSLAEGSGLGARLTPSIEREFRFREEAVYRCLTDPSISASADWS
jgi:L-alanine-DL-glutamate epimerase-like enolase superfamily enzyme